MKSKQVCKRLFGVFFALVLLVSAVMSGRVTLPAFAAETGYTGALEDLQKDENFNVSDYPDKANDYSINVIQIAESTDGEFFIYTYQPCQKTRYLVATEINMSLTDKMGGEVAEDEELSPADSPELYGLTLLSSDGVLCKYKINDFTVSEDETRYYNIASIYREWIKGVDKDTGNDSIKNAVAFPVGKLYTVTTEGGNVVYACVNREVVKILNPFWSYVRYTDGFGWHKEACDSHYVAFSTNWQIDALYEAELRYTARGAHSLGRDGQVEGVSFDDPLSYSVVLTDNQEYHKDASWLWDGESADYSRIQSVAEFVGKEELKDSTKKSLSGLQWVLRFAETDYTYQKYLDGTFFEDYIFISNVAILRLKFESEGVVYNLGAVSDKGMESGLPSNKPRSFNFWQYVWNCVIKLFNGTATVVETVVAIVAIFVVVLALPIILTVLSFVFPSFGALMKTIFKGIGKGFWWLLKGFWWLVCAPFKGIAMLVHKTKKE